MAAKHPIKETLNKKKKNWTNLEMRIKQIYTKNFIDYFIRELN